MSNSRDLSQPFERWIVLDTGALIAGTDKLYALGGLTDSINLTLPPKLLSNETVKFFVTPDVACETRDPNARNRLQALERLGCIVARAPSAEAVAEVAQYAKLTGDYPVLSVADLRVLALTYMLEVERNGHEFLKRISEGRVVGEIRSARTVKFEEVDRWEREEREERERSEREEGDADGWTKVATRQNLPKRPKKKKGKKMKQKKGKAEVLNLEQNQKRPSRAINQLTGSNKNETHAALPLGIVSEVAEVAEASHSDTPMNISKYERHMQNDSTYPNIETASKLLNGLEFQSNAIGDRKVDIDDSCAGEKEETLLDLGVDQGIHGKKITSEITSTEILSEEDDGVGWINEDNLEEHLARDGGEKTVTEEDRRRVACVTTDFALQNTMLQMGLKLLSVDGRRTIRQIKRFALRCQSCSAITRELHRKFCAQCGNATLHRVAFKVDKKGVARVFLNPKKTPTLRGTKYPIPLPRGGRHSKDLILCEDQIDPVKQKRIEKQRQRLNVDVLDPGSFYNAGARFNPLSKPLIVGYGKRNPNQVRPSSKSKR